MVAGESKGWHPQGADPGFWLMTGSEIHNLNVEMLGAAEDRLGEQGWCYRADLGLWLGSCKSNPEAQNNIFFCKIGGEVWRCRSRIVVREGGGSRPKNANVTLRFGTKPLLVTPLTKTAAPFSDSDFLHQTDLSFPPPTWHWCPSWARPLKWRPLEGARQPVDERRFEALTSLGL